MAGLTERMSLRGAQRRGNLGFPGLLRFARNDGAFIIARRHLRLGSLLGNQPVVGNLFPNLVAVQLVGLQIRHQGNCKYQVHLSNHHPGKQ